jgi:D-serine deaminase-like pyridoxal phosphate-dependent protein
MTMPDHAALPTPAILVDRSKVAANLRRMQQVCDANGVELRPHMKTHKMVEVARQQVAGGARGLTCAKLGEAEAMLPSGVQEIFLAHSLADPGQAPRIAALAEKLRDLRVAVTSAAHLEGLTRVAAAVGRKLGVMMAVDTGLGREGVRSDGDAVRLAAQLARHPWLELRGLYCHEGHLYAASAAEFRDAIECMVDRLDGIRKSIDPGLAIWPGCSVTAHLVAALSNGRVQAVRPGAYVFGDLSLARTTGVMKWDEVAVQVLATVVDKPEPGLALIDAGSKTFSSDRTPQNIFGLAVDGRDLAVVRVNEEHGYVRGADVEKLQVGERVAFMPAHICTVINLTDAVTVTEGGKVVDSWRVTARGRTA